MDFGFLRLKRQITRFCLFICTLMMAFSAKAIVSIDPLPTEKTPLLLRSIKEGHAEFFRRYNLNVSDPSALKSFYVKILKDIEPTFKEILLAQLNGYKRENHADNMLSEFQRLQADILSRGFEPSTNQYWAPSQQLNLIWNLQEQEFEFELDLNYQPIGKRLEEHNTYPRVALKGLLILLCSDPVESPKRFDNCQVQGAEIRASTVEWHSIPGSRGGNSSAGGGTSKIDVMSKPLIIQNIPMAQSMGLIKNEKIQIFLDVLKNYKSTSENLSRNSKDQESK